MNEPTKPEHNPWAGSRYRSESRRLLLLGKAHYHVDPNEDSSELTTDVIKRERDGITHERFFIMAAELVGPLLQPPASARADFWERVAFANYSPQTVGQHMRDEPTSEMWQRGQVRFIEMLESLAPTHVLSLGKEQWNAIAFPAGWTSTLITRTDAGEIRRWQSPAHSIVATPINHPTGSQGFSPGHWIEHVRVFLAQDP